MNILNGKIETIFIGGLSAIAWSSAANTLAISARSYGDPPTTIPGGIYLWRPGDRQARRAATGEPNLPAVWSPTGEWAAFSSNGVYLAANDPEHEPIELTESSAYAIAWSPDGHYIAFTRGCIDPGIDACGPDLYLVDSTGDHKRLLADGWIGNMAFSPDGSRIAYTNRHDGFADIYLINRDGGAMRQLTDEPQIDEIAPRWSPDGTAIAYARISGVCQVETCTEDILVRAVDGGKPRQIFAAGERGGLLSWGWIDDERLFMLLRETDDTARLLALNTDGAPLGETIVNVPLRQTER